MSLIHRAAAPLLVLALSSSSACRRQTDATLRAPCVPAALVAAVPLAAPVSLDPRPEPDPSAVVARARASVVSVIAGHPAETHGIAPREHALGSGILLASDGLVLTSRHVIDGADDLQVALDDGRSFAGRVVAEDALLDIALVRLAGARGLPVADLGSSAAIRVGEPVIAIGNPFGLGPSVRRGVLSAPAREVDDGPGGELLQSDAAVNPGDSGGPLLDAMGLVIGVNTAIVEHGQGVSLAVPIDDVRAVLREMETTGHVTRGHAGIAFQPVDAALGRALGMSRPSGAIVTDVEGLGPAERAGVHAGDVIAALDGRPIRRGGDLSHELERRKPGDVVSLKVLREGATTTLAVVLDRDRSEHDAEPRATRAVTGSETAGLHLADAAGEGARIEALDPASTAADGLRAGDVVVEVNRVPVRCAADVARKLRGAPRPSTALLRVRRATEFLYVGIDLGA